jgi:hypothetical protein
MNNVSENHVVAYVPAAIGVLCVCIFACSNCGANPVPCSATPPGSKCASPNCDVNISGISGAVGAYGFTGSVKDDPAWKSLVNDTARRALVLDFLTCRAFESPAYQGFDCPNNETLVRSSWADLYDGKGVTSPLLHACKCGRSGGECCVIGEPCDPSLICQGTECRPCGAVGQPCCTTGDPCTSSVCVNKVCVKSKYEWVRSADQTVEVWAGTCKYHDSLPPATCNTANVSKVIAWLREPTSEHVEQKDVGFVPFAQGTKVEYKDDKATITGWHECGSDNRVKMNLHTVTCSVVPDR